MFLQSWGKKDRDCSHHEKDKRGRWRESIHNHEIRKREIVHVTTWEGRERESTFYNREIWRREIVHNPEIRGRKRYGGERLFTILSYGGEKDMEARDCSQF